MLVTEKDDCLEFARKLVREFGVSHYHLGRQPSLVRSEHVAQRLLKMVQSIRVVAYVDYDAGGWVLGRAGSNQLEKQGLHIDRFDYLVREECFSEEEKQLYSHPCKMGSQALKPRWPAGLLWGAG